MYGSLEWFKVFKAVRAAYGSGRSPRSEPEEVWESVYPQCILDLTN